MGAGALFTLNVLVTPIAGFQLESPSCEADTLTIPAAVKVRFVPSSCPGPSTARLTGNADSAVAISGTVLVAYWSPGSGKVIDWSPRTTASVPLVCPT